MLYTRMSPRLAQGEDERCAALWRSVLCTAYADLAKGDLGAGYWASDDCRQVCEYAGIDWLQAQRAAKRIAADRASAELVKQAEIKRQKRQKE